MSDLQQGVLASIAAAYVEFAVTHELRRADALAAAGLTEDELADPDGLVPATAMMGLWALLVGRLPSR